MIFLFCLSIVWCQESKCNNRLDDDNDDFVDCLDSDCAGALKNSIHLRFCLFVWAYLVIVLSH
jgi:hypothetical protein